MVITHEQGCPRGGGGVVVPPHSGAKADHIPGPILPSASLGNLCSQLVLTALVITATPCSCPPAAAWLI